MKNKTLYLDSILVKREHLPAVEGEIESIIVEGFASTNDIDRQGDIVPTSVWEKGLVNYLKNPIILAHHHYDEPVGRMLEHRIDEKGLWIRARVSAAATEVFNLVKDGIMTGFSIGFRINDADYNAPADVFVIKDLELLEISLVSIPANQNTLFSLSKSFENDSEYNSFKMNFTSESDSAKELENLDPSVTKKDEWNMEAEELKKLLADAAHEAAVKAAEAVVAKQAEQAAAEAAKAAEIEVGKSGAEKLLADIEKRFATEAEINKSAIAGLEAVIAEKAAELDAIQKSKMQFSDSRNGEASYQDKEKAVLLSYITGKGIGESKFARSLIEKTGAHVASATWELEVSLSMEAEVRRRLVVAPTLQSIAMQTNVMTIPINPEAVHATWVTNAQFGSTDSSGAAVTHALGELTLNAYKVATKEYLNFEEEEDALLAILPIVRDRMIRSLARAVDKAFLIGAGSGADPVKGLAIYDASSTVSAAVAAKATVANMTALRRDIGAWGLDPTAIRYIVSTDIYYDLLDDTTFQTVDKVADRATLLTGQIGSIGNSPVLVSAEFATKAATSIGAICFAPDNFIVGNQRGMRVDTQDLVETQRKVLVSSLRTGMMQTTTNLGAGVSTFRWTA